MSDSLPIPSVGAEGVRSSTSAQPAARARASGPAFEALLERLSTRAAELEQRSQTLESAAELPEAVDAARASLEDALHLGAELLEAYRAAQRGGGGAHS